MNDETHYRAYLIRFQRGEKQTHWRVTLQDAHQGTIHRFATENDLIRYLLYQLNESSSLPDLNTDLETDHC